MSIPPLRGVLYMASPAYPELSAFEKLQPRSAMVVERLKAAVLSGALVPGQELNERRLAESFEVSKTPVREALIAFMRSGLAVRNARGAVIVRPVNKEFIESVQEMRLLLEPAAVRQLWQSEFEGLRAAGILIGSA